MNYSSVENIRIPLLIPRRGKGHSEVLASCKVASEVAFSPLEFIQHVIPFAKRTCTPDVPLEMAAALCRELRISSVNVELAFPYMLDRASPQFEEAFFELPCKYTASREKRKHSSTMSVRLPIRIKDIHVVRGSLDFVVETPHCDYFEDLVDHVQKSAGVILYPLRTAWDKEPLSGMIDRGKTVREYLELLKKSSKNAKLGKGGTISVYVTDVYGMYDLTNSITW